MAGSKPENKDDDGFGQDSAGSESDETLILSGVPRFEVIK
jgi:hypothetical protein